MNDNTVNGVPSIPTPECEGPAPGKPLSLKDLDMILEAVESRNKKFPEEPSGVTIAIIFMNIGDRFAPVSCVSDIHRWEGLKKDIQVKNPTDLPTCPDGHVLVQGKGLRIGWIAED